MEATKLLRISETELDYTLRRMREYREAALAYRQLSICLRVQQRPAEPLIKQLEKADRTMSAG